MLICGAGILALAIPTGIFGSKFFTQDTVGWIILIEVVPLAAIGWFNYNDMPIEVIGKKAIRYYVESQKRKLKFKPFEVKLHETLIDIEYSELSNERSEELKRLKGHTLLELNPITGRTHQIRVHLSYIGHSIIGDKIYSKNAKIYKMKGFALISKEIHFIHPITKKNIDIIVNYNNEFLSRLKLLDNAKN